MLRSLLALSLAACLVTPVTAAQVRFSPVPRLPFFWGEAERADRSAAARAWQEMSTQARATAMLPPSAPVPFWDDLGATGARPVAPRLGGPCPGPARRPQPRLGGP